LNIKCDLIFSAIFVRNVFHSKKKWARYEQKKRYTGLQVKCPLFLSDFNETWIISTDFRNIVKYQISWNPSSGSRVVPCGQTDGRTDGRTDMTKLVIGFRNFANAPKNESQELRGRPLPNFRL
jgi:hypothetical protein